MAAAPTPADQVVVRVAFTEEAADLVRRLTAIHGPVMFHQSGGCCDGSAPMCYPQGDLITGDGDTRLGERGRGGFDAALATTFGDGTEAAQALRRGDAGVAAGTHSELESVLGADPRFAIAEWPGPPVAARGWAIGCAVRRDAEDLALALQQAVNTLAADGRLAALFAAGGVGWRRP